MSLNYDPGLTLSMKVTDLNRSIDWYQSVLGYKLLYKMDDMGWCELSSPVDKVNVGLSQVEEVPSGGPVPTWGVVDIVEAKKKLEEHGVRFDGDIMEIPGMVKLLTFFDPDGNGIMLFQDMQGQ